MLLVIESGNQIQYIETFIGRKPQGKTQCRPTSGSKQGSTTYRPLQQSFDKNAFQISMHRGARNDSE